MIDQLAATLAVAVKSQIDPCLLKVVLSYSVFIYVFKSRVRLVFEAGINLTLSIPSSTVRIMKDNSCCFGSDALLDVSRNAPRYSFHSQ